MMCKVKSISHLILVTSSVSIILSQIHLDFVFFTYLLKVLYWVGLNPVETRAGEKSSFVFLGGGGDQNQAKRE